MKIIHASEMHLNVDTQERVLLALDKIIEYASQQEYSVVFFTGDFFDRAIQNTERSGLTKCLEKLKELSSHGCIVMTYGTRSSHDIDGCYDVFRQYATILTPKDNVMKTKALDVVYLPEIMSGDLSIDPTKTENIQDLIIAECQRRCKEAKTDKHTIVLGHGTVLSESTLKNPVIEYTGKYHYKEEWLKDMNAGLYLFGHLHLPYRFTNIKGGYVGSLAHDYRDTGFKPGFDVYDFDTYEYLERVDLPFSGKETLKIEYTTTAVILQEKDIPLGFTIKPTVTLSSENNTMLKRQKVRFEIAKAYPDREIEYLEVKVSVGNKVRTQEVVFANHYRDMYKLYEPDATEKDLLVQDQLEKEDIELGVIPKKTDINFERLEVSGYKPISKTLEEPLVFTKLSKGVHALTAKGGYGKSSLSDLLYPHPECLSKPSMKHELLDDNGYIKQEYTVDGQTVETLIIKGVSGTTFKFIVDGVEMCKKNMREYKELVNKMFGSLQSVAIAAISSQRPLSRIVDGKNPDIDLFNTNNGEMKDTYNEFCGSDKSATQKRCKEKKDAFKKELETVLSEKQGVEKILEDMEVVDTSSLEEDVKVISDIINKKELEIAEKQKLMEQLGEAQKASEESKIALSKTESSYKESNIAKVDAEIKVEKLRKSIIVDKTGINTMIGATEVLLEKNKQAQAYNEKANAEYAENMNIYQEKLDKFNEVVYENSNRKNAIIGFRKDIETKHSRMDSCKLRIDSVKACPQCGYVDSSSNEIIESSKREIDSIERDIMLLDENIENLSKDFISNEDLDAMKALIIKPKLELRELETVQDISELQKQLSESDNAEKVLPDYIKMLEDAQLKENELKNELEKLQEQVQTDNSETISILFGEIQIMNREQAERKDAIDSKKKIIAEQESKKALASEIEMKLSMYEEHIDELETSINDWERYEKAWSKNGIPARFIEVTAPTIDGLTNELLSQFYPNFFVETVLTKDDGKGKVIDTFDIVCYNLEKGESYSIRSLSGEQGEFVKMALYASFRKQYTETTGRKFNFLFLDEQDKHVCLARQPDFFAMVEHIQKESDNSVICVSHSAEAQNNLPNVINMEEM